MTIETKFNLNDVVFFFERNQIVRATISAIETFNVGTNQDYIKYSAKDYYNEQTWLDHNNLPEKRLYSSKEELLQSL